MKAYALGRTTLQNLIDREGLSVERVDDVMVSLQQVLDDQRLVDTVLGQELAAVEFSDQDLLHELDTIAHDAIAHDAIAHETIAHEPVPPPVEEPHVARVLEALDGLRLEPAGKAAVREQE